MWALTVAVAVGGVAAVAALPSPAVAAGSSTIALDAPDNGTPPQIAYDPTTQTTRQAYDLLAQGFGPGFCWIVGVDSPVGVVSGVLGFVLRAKLCLVTRNS